MKVFAVYCHPSEDSLTAALRDRFLRGLEDGGNQCVVSDLYKMNFNADLGEAEYAREAHYRRSLPVPADVKAEQEKINAADAIAFIYPVFWSDAPAKLVGWFSRVWTFGFAYGEGRAMKQLEKALFLVSAGNTLDYFAETGLLDAMKKVMLSDRIFDRAKRKEMFVFDGTSRENSRREEMREAFLAQAYELGKNF